jgi:hypothetical protein
MKVVNVGVKRALFAVLVFVFVAVGATVTAKSSGGKHEGKGHKTTEKAKKRPKKKSTAELKGDKSLAAASEQTNEVQETAVHTARSAAEGQEEISENDEG